MLALIYRDDQWGEIPPCQVESRVGGKAKNLYRLTEGGFSVPQFFVITTEAYREFLAYNNFTGPLQQAVYDMLCDERRGDGYGRLERSFIHGDLPDEVRNSVLAAHREMGEQKVAVRSSATAEDLATASFAGQYETFLNVKGEEDLLRAVKRCWASLWTPRAVHYRAQRDIDHRDSALAVIVQKMIEAEGAGVAFSADPTSGHRGRVVIDATPGLGDKLVSGEVTPQHWVVAADEGEIVKKEAHGSPVLTREQVLHLSRLAKEVETYFEAPQDIEWALEKGKIHFLQTRPITTLFPLPSGASQWEEVRIYVCANRLQGLVEPITPMGLSVFGRLALGLQKILRWNFTDRYAPPAFNTAAFRMYIDVTDGLRDPRAKALLLNLSGVADQPTSHILQKLLHGTPDLCSLSQDESPSLRPRPLALLRAVVNLVRALARPRRGRNTLLRKVERWVQDKQTQAAEMEDPQERFHWIMDTCTQFSPRFFVNMVPLVAAGIGSRFGLERLLEEWVGDAKDLEPVLRALPHNPTTEMNLRLWRISRRLKENGEEPTAKHPLVEKFLREYGHRTAREIDVGMPRWRENPQPVLQTLRTYLSQTQEVDPEEHFTRQKLRAEEAAISLQEKVRRQSGWLRGSLAGFLLNRLRRLGGLREYPKFLAVKVFALLRQVLLELGEELAERDELSEAGDVFYVTLRDIGAAVGDEKREADLKEKAENNQLRYDRELERKNIPRVMTSKGETFYGSGVQREEGEGGQLLGTGVSVGTYTGPARIVFDPGKGDLKPGEVLVAPATDPAWTPLFLSAGALVMETGGTMSHGSVVAREYGIPAVVGVDNATREIETGDKVTVDGEKGVVFLAGKEDDAVS